MPRTAALAIAVAVLVAASTAAAAPRPDGVWVNGKTHTLLTAPPSAGATHGLALYVIAPISTSHPLHALAAARTHGFGAHDHVIARAPYTGTCDLELVVPGPKPRPGATVGMRMTLTPAGVKPLLFAARLGAATVPLDRASRIAQAVRAGLAHVVDTHTLLSCKVS